MKLRNIFLLMLLIAFFLLLYYGHLKKQGKRKYKAAKEIRSYCVIAFLVSILGLSFIWAHDIMKKSRSIYTEKTIYVWADELYGESIDPASFESIEKSTVTDKNGGDDAQESGEESNITQVITAVEASEEIYAFEFIDTEATVSEEEISKQYEKSLQLFGPYMFGDVITNADIQNMTLLVEDFEVQNRYLKYENYAEDEDVSVIRERINDFDWQKKNNQEQLYATNYYQNYLDRMWLFRRNGSIDVLEQAAIAAEGAVECKHMKTIEDYSEWFIYVGATAAGFDHVFSSESGQYYSGTEGDVCYRAGKVLYKPAVNLKNISEENRRYSLCCAYVFLRRAFRGEVSVQKYKIETAYYYLRVCADIAKRMPEEDAEAVCREAIVAYQVFDEEGEQNPDNQTYAKYKGEAEKAYERVKSYL